MTAFTQYQQLSAAGLWRDTPEAQRRDVTATIGQETLTLTDPQGRPLAHWSIAAIGRANPGETPAVFHPDGDPGETLELDETQAEMIAALDRMRTLVERRRPHPGRLRLVILVAVLLAVVGGGVFWLPDAMRRHAVSVVPKAKRAEIGEMLKDEIARVSGPPCNRPEGQAALDRLARRVAPDEPGLNVQVVRQGVTGALLLPGRAMLLNRALIEDYEEPDVVAGYMVAELHRAASGDPLAGLLDRAGLAASFRLLTTGDLPRGALRNYAEHLLTGNRARPLAEALLPRFEAAGVRSSPYAYALDVTGESVLELIEADPHAGEAPPPLLRDADWLRLQTICGA
ncbi:hypothetical protein OB2597_06310 [Pseudooceanicola batsensis HTCC2597]|uniref:Peptidase M48 domain-containing protein n=1 Tax=Pseudooceanicola batsensis (strain ATCC BAA-863 / DSM 15984 / KCTC 12145 / HTCC2597) TaxID=252305 RepID=A3TT97_PSEBH|nr:hypothetical protein [Pseudooceanicola batsensis]EAQ04874.1 hypothetical protein OB2597_06310 [Pseudooceanicola batsensis HTCC2597]